MRILLCCAGGFSTNMLMQNMAKVVKDSHKLNEDDFKFDAIPVDGLEEEIDNYDIVLVGPNGWCHGYKTSTADPCEVSKKARWLTFHRYDFERGLHDVQSIRVFHEPLLHADRTKGRQSASSKRDQGGDGRHDTVHHPRQYFHDYSGVA